VQSAQREFHIARRAVSMHRALKNDFGGWQIAEYSYERTRDALYAALSWLWDVQQRAQPRTWVWLSEIEPSMTARRKAA
jgi:hypothetical protein